MPDRRKLLRAWLYAMTRLEVHLRTDQARARNAMIRAAAYLYAATGSVPTHVLIAHRKRTEQNLTAAYRRTIPVFADMAMKQIKSRRIERKSFDTLVAQWISRQALRKATMIADTDRDDVLAAISTGMTEGLGTEEIARNIRKVSQLTAFRAATVARTETHASATFGSIESVRQAEQDLGVKMNKEWAATKDDRTRPEHLDADGQQVGLDEKFTVGGEEMDRPGDPSASADQLVNCRCGLVYSEKE